MDHMKYQQHMSTPFNQGFDEHVYYGGCVATPPEFNITAGIDEPLPIHIPTIPEIMGNPQVPQPEIDAKKAIEANNKSEFRIDWVRNLQLELLGSRISTDGNFDEATVKQVARFQQVIMGQDKPSGIIDGDTRRKLEAIYHRLYIEVLGDKLDARVLVPASATGDQRYDYWKKIIQDAGGHFMENDKEVNLLGIRGVKIADGSDEHQVNGTTLASGDIYQTESANDFAKARQENAKSGKDSNKDNHLSGKHNSFDDLMVSLWMDGKDKKVEERRGNVDPRSKYTDDKYGTGHLSDGQYAYRTGRHGTTSGTHKSAVKGMDKKDRKYLNVADYTRSDGKKGVRYDALVPTRNQEVWREHDKNDLYLSESEENYSREAIYNRDKKVAKYGNRYVNDNFAMNIHTSSTKHPNSQACMNVPADEYPEFMKEIKDSNNKKNVLFTLIDTSKISEGLKVVKTETIQE